MPVFDTFFFMALGKIIAFIICGMVLLWTCFAFPKFGRVMAVLYIGGFIIGFLLFTANILSSSERYKATHQEDTHGRSDR